MDTPESKSSNSKMTWIIVGVIAALVVLGISLYAIIMAAMPRQATSNQTPTTTQTLTKEQVRSRLDDVSKTLEQDKADRKKAQQALDDNINRIKLSN